MSNTENEMVEAAKSEEKVRVYTELGLSKNPTTDAKNTDSIKAYFNNLLKQKHVSAQIVRIKGKSSSVNDDPHFSQFLHESAQSPDIATDATNKLIAYQIKNANHDLLANVVAALIFEPSQNKNKLEEWGILVNDSAGLTNQGNRLWSEGTGTWRETLIFKPVTTKFDDLLKNNVTINDILKDWGVSNSSLEGQLFTKLKNRWRPFFIQFIKNDKDYRDKIKLANIIINLENEADKKSIKDIIIKGSKNLDDDINELLPTS